MVNTVLLILTFFTFIQCKNSPEKTLNNQTKLKTTSKSELLESKTESTHAKDTILVKLNSLEVVINLDKDEKEDFSIEYSKLVGYDKHEGRNIYGKTDTININSEYSEMTGASNLSNKKLSFNTIIGVERLEANVTYIMGISYGFDSLGEYMPPRINEYSYKIKDSVLLDLSSENGLIIKSDKDLKLLIYNKHFKEIRKNIYSDKKELYKGLISDKSSIYYKDDYYRKSMEEFLSKEISDFKTIEDLDGSVQAAHIIIEFKGKIKGGKEFTEYLGG